MIPFLVKLGPNEKRIIIIAVLLLIVFFFLFGLAVKHFKYRFRKAGKGIDTYMGELLKYQVITKRDQMRHYVRKREGHAFFFHMMIPLAGFIAINIIYFSYALMYNISWNHFFFILRDLGIKLVTPKSEFFGVMIHSDWPEMVKSPTIHFDSLPIYLFAIGTLVFTYILYRRTLIYLARVNRGKEKAKTVFGNDLDNMHFESR